VRNRDTLKTDAWLNDANAWSTVYIEERDMLALCPNPYIFEKGRSQMTQYTYNRERGQMQLVFLNNRSDTARFQVRHYDGRKMQWEGIVDNDTLSMQLSKDVEDR
jgi:hypothetical protein